MTFYHVRRTHSQYSLNILLSFNDDAASPPRLLKSGSGFAAAHAVVASGECETGGGDTGCDGESGIGQCE